MDPASDAVPWWWWWWILSIKRLSICRASVSLWRLSESCQLPAASTAASSIDDVVSSRRTRWWWAMVAGDSGTDGRTVPTRWCSCVVEGVLVLITSLKVGRIDGAGPGSGTVVTVVVVMTLVVVEALVVGVSSSSVSSLWSSSSSSLTTITGEEGDWGVVVGGVKWWGRYLTRYRRIRWRRRPSVKTLNVKSFKVKGFTVSIDSDLLRTCPALGV